MYYRNTTFSIYYDIQYLLPILCKYGSCVTIHIFTLCFDFNLRKPTLKQLNKRILVTESNDLFHHLLAATMPTLVNGEGDSLTHRVFILLLTHSPPEVSVASLHPQVCPSASAIWSNDLMRVRFEAMTFLCECNSKQWPSYASAIWSSDLLMPVRFEAMTFLCECDLKQWPSYASAIWSNDLLMRVRFETMTFLCECDLKQLPSYASAIWSNDLMQVRFETMTFLCDCDLKQWPSYASAIWSSDLLMQLKRLIHSP